MATKTVVCPDCERPVEPGRYSCSGCGALLVPVAGARIAPSNGGAAEPAPAREPDVLQRVAEAPELWPAAAPDSLWTEAAVRSEDPAADVAPEPAPDPEPSWPARPAWPPSPESLRPAPPAAPAGQPADRVPAGSYLPPSVVLLPTDPALALADPSATPAATTDGSTPADGAATTADTGRALLASLPTDVPTRLIATGAGIAGLGFLLPWSEVVVGSGAFGGYLAQWGLAGPAHLVVVVALLGIWAMALAGHRLPVRIRPAVPAIAASTLLLGLVWPYLFSVLGALIGTWVVVAGAVTMAVGGVLDLAAERHQPAGPAVE